MEKNLKFTANELLDSLNRELNQNEVNELYKALLAYHIGLEKIDETEERALNEVIKTYFDRDDITSFINEDLLDKYLSILEENYDMLIIKVKE